MEEILNEIQEKRRVCAVHECANTTDYMTSDKYEVNIFSVPSCNQSLCRKAW